MDKYDDDVVEHFWAQVDLTGGPNTCWNWTGIVHANGYGAFNLGTRQGLSHRLALELSGVRIPAGLIVMRTCGNRLCCNPAHLYVATPSERMAARSRPGRIPRPEKREEPEAR